MSRLSAILTDFVALKLLVKTDFDHVIKVMLYKGFENDEIRKVNDDANTS